MKLYENDENFNNDYSNLYDSFKVTNLSKQKDNKKYMNLTSGMLNKKYNNENNYYNKNYFNDESLNDDYLNKKNEKENFERKFETFPYEKENKEILIENNTKNIINKSISNNLNNSKNINNNNNIINKINIYENKKMTQSKSQETLRSENNKNSFFDNINNNVLKNKNKNNNSFKKTYSASKNLTTLEYAKLIVLILYFQI